MGALLLEFLAAFQVNQCRCHIRKLTLGISAGGMTLRLDEDSPARTQPSESVVQAAGDANQFSRHRGIQVGTPKFRGTLE